VTVLIEMELPARREDIEELTRRIGAAENPPDGLLIHTAVETPNGLRVVDVWDSQADFERFQESRLNQAAGALMAERGMDGPMDLQPKITEAFDIVRGKSLG
jgi:hypothetical protein